jgi:hypothetical protein
VRLLRARGDAQRRRSAGRRARSRRGWSPRTTSRGAHLRSAARRDGAAISTRETMQTTSRLVLLLAVVATATLGTAQTPFTLTAHPQETVDNGNGNLVPFGLSNTGSFASGRTMILVPKHELPSIPCLLLGIEVECQQTVALTYTSLDINCAPTTATTLQATFAANYTTPPTPVLTATNLTVNWQNNTFVPITFTTPYVHDGSSALIIEIQKEIPVLSPFPFATMSTSSSPPRNDRPNMRYAFGTSGSNASQAPTAQVAANALLFRLQWQGTPTVRNKSDVGPGNNQYGLGGSVTLTISGPAGHLYAMAAGDSFLATQVPIPGIGGAVLIDNIVLFTSGLLDTAGDGTFLLNIPVDPALVGFYLAYQGAVVDPTTGAITLTNGTDHFVNP